MADNVSGDTSGYIPVLSDVFGSKPAVAPYTPTDFSAEQQKSLTENIGAFPDITQLGDLYQQYMLADLNKAMPGFSGLLAEGSATSKEMLDAASPLLRGEIPQDVQDQVYRSSAYQSLMSGTAGSPMSKALTARDLGLTSLGLEQQGAQLAMEGGNAAQRWAGLAEGTMMNPSSMLITPQQQAALTMQNNLYKQATQQYANNVAASPDPVAKGISDTIMSLVGAYLGGGRGGGGSSGGSGGTPGGAGVASYQNFGYAQPVNTTADTGAFAPSGNVAFSGDPASGGGINLGGYGGYGYDSQYGGYSSPFSTG